MSRTPGRILTSRPPEHLPVPPSTPVSELPHPETSNDAHSGTPRGPRSLDSRDASLPGTPNASSSTRRKSRKKARPTSAYSPIVEWLKPSLVLENSGSVARDHLASERTFLAYIRTSLLLATTGVGFVQLFAVASSSNSKGSSALIRLRQFARPLGATLVVVGLLVLILGIRRYFLIQAFLTKGLFPVTRFSIVGVAIILTIIIIIVFVVLVSVRN